MKQGIAPYTSVTSESLQTTLATHISLEAAIWIGLTLAAFITRVWHLDLAPLSSVEARHALDALALTHGQSISVFNPLFASVQAIIMSVFGASEFSARLPSAVMGAVICVLPVLLRDETDRLRAIAFSVLLIMSPALTFASRQADGGLFAWAIAFWAVLSWKTGRTSAAAIGTGLLLACGQDAVTPLLIISAGAISPLLRSRLPIGKIGVTRQQVLIAVITFICGATLLLWRPAGFGDVFSGIANWWTSLWTVGQLGLLRIILGLSVYEILLVLSAAAGLVITLLQRRWQPTDSMWSIWVAAGLILLFLNSSRSIADMTPVVIGCAGIGATAWDGLWESYKRHVEPLWSEGLVGAITITMLVYAYLGLTMFAEQLQGAYLVSILLAFLMITGTAIICILLLDGMVAIRGVTTAVGIGLLVYTFAVGYHLTQVRVTNPSEIYNADVSADGLPMLVDAINTASIRAYSDANSLPMQVVDTAPPALKWALRNQRNITYVAHLTNSPAVLTPINEKPGGVSSYIGSAFRISNTATLSELTCHPGGAEGNQVDCTSLFRWLTQRTLDERVITRWILWLRSDTALKASGLH